jgi:hypothetical protein
LDPASSAAELVLPDGPPAGITDTRAVCRWLQQRDDQTQMVCLLPGLWRRAPVQRQLPDTGGPIVGRGSKSNMQRYKGVADLPHGACNFESSGLRAAAPGYGALQCAARMTAIEAAELVQLARCQEG